MLFRSLKSLDTLIVSFDRDMLHDGSEHAADKIENYLLVEANGDGFQTTTCATDVEGNDTRITILNASYENNAGAGPYQVTLNVGPLTEGSYQLLVCGSASIHDLVGSVLNAGTDSIINFTVAAAPQPEALPQTGFAPDVITQLPVQGGSELYQQYD